MAQLTAGLAESVLLYSGVESQMAPFTMENGTHGSATTWYKGDLVVTASGLVNAVASTGAITGIAMAAASATSYTDIDIALIDPAAIYVMRIEYGEESARAYIGEAHGLQFTAGMQRLLLSAHATPDVVVVGVHPSDVGAASAGVDEGRLLVRFNYDIFTGVSGA